MTGAFLLTEVLKHIKKQKVKEKGLLPSKGRKVMEDDIASLSIGVAHQPGMPNFIHCRETFEKKDKKYLELERLNLICKNLLYTFFEQYLI